MCPPRSPLPLVRFLRFIFLRFPSFTLVPFQARPFRLFFGLGTQFRCSSFHRLTVRLTAALRAACLPSRVQAFPLASFFQVFPPFRLSSASPQRFPASFSASSALGSGYWA